jgi:hypothetical protein
MSANSGTTLIIGLVVLGCVCSSSSSAAALGAKYFTTGEDSEGGGGGGGGGGGSGGFFGGLMDGLNDPIGGFGDLMNLIDGSGGTMQLAPAGHSCESWCGDCSQADYDRMHASAPEQSASDFKAICENNRSAYSDTQAHWDVQIHKVGTNCC